MAKKRGLLLHAAKAVKQQQKAAAGQKPNKAAPSGRGSGSQPAGKKQKIDSSNATTKTLPSAHARQQNQKPTIPFYSSDTILLVGEADLSFAASLITHHKCTNVTATVLEKDAAELSSKYPHVSANISLFESPEHPGCRLLYGIDARKMGPFTTTSTSSSTPRTGGPSSRPAQGGGGGAMKRIMFNFPHVGGKSTDVNRQVRYNQELLVDFFRRAQLSLSPDRGSSIIVTLFEGEPYTLWNVRDLARHAGLEVATSFRFSADAYPGYAHARTLGVVRNRKGEVAKAAWKGEHRPARSYVFVRKGEAEDALRELRPGMVEGGKRKRKRGRGGEGTGSSSSSEDESGQEEYEEQAVGDDLEEGWSDEDGDGDEIKAEEAGSGSEDELNDGKHRSSDAD